MRFALKFELAAADLARAAAWYSDVLGLEPVDPDGEQLVYRVEGTVFGIYPSENAGTNKATAVRLVVDDFDAARAEMLSKGVVFEEYDLGPDFRTVDGLFGRSSCAVQGRCGCQHTDQHSRHVRGDQTWPTGTLGDERQRASAAACSTRTGVGPRAGLQESLHPDPPEGRVLDSAESPHPITG